MNDEQTPLAPQTPLPPSTPAQPAVNPPQQQPATETVVQPPQAVPQTTPSQEQTNPPAPVQGTPSPQQVPPQQATTTPTTSVPAQNPVANQPASVAPVAQPMPPVTQGGMKPASFLKSLSVSGKSKKMIIIAVSAIAAVAGIVIVALFVLPSLLGGSVKLVEYKNESQGFSIKYPENWEKDERNEDYDTHTKFTEDFDAKDKSDGASYSAELKISKNEATSDYMKVDEDEFLKSYGEGIRKAVDDGKDEDYPRSEYPLNADLDETTVSGHPALIVKADVNNFQSSEDQKGIQYGAFVWVNESLQYVVTLGAHEDDSDIAEQWDKILASFEIDE